MACPKCRSLRVRPANSTGGLWCALCGHAWNEVSVAEAVAAAVASAIAVPAQPILSTQAPPAWPILSTQAPPACGFCGRPMTSCGAPFGASTWSCVHLDATIVTSLVVP